jgi:hypothetical protein
MRALRLLARVTLFVDYHDAVVAVPAVTVGRCRLTLSNAR